MSRQQQMAMISQKRYMKIMLPEYTSPIMDPMKSTTIR